MRVLRNVLFFLSVLFVLLACNTNSSKELTRSQAKSVIEASQQFKTSDPAIGLEPADVEAGVKAGYWVKKPWIFGAPLELTPAGHKYFTGFEPQIQGTIVKCVKAPKWYIAEVTGITDAPGSVDGNLKVVEVMVDAKFDGEMNDIVKVLNVRPTKASITLRRYDDGWRVQE